METFWLPVLGPSATWALRRLAAWLEAEPHGFPLPQIPLARELGLGGHVGRHSTAVRRLGRPVLFKMARVTYDDHLAVRLVIPPLPPRLIAQLPEHLAMQHPTHACRSAAGTGSPPVVEAWRWSGKSTPPSTES